MDNESTTDSTVVDLAGSPAQEAVREVAAVEQHYGKMYLSESVAAHHRHAGDQQEVWISMANGGSGIDGRMTEDRKENGHALQLHVDGREFRPQNSESMSACAEFPRRAPPSFVYACKERSSRVPLNDKCLL